MRAGCVQQEKLFWESMLRLTAGMLLKGRKISSVSGTKGEMDKKKVKTHLHTIFFFFFFFFFNHPYLMLLFFFAAEIKFHFKSLRTGLSIFPFTCLIY